MLRLFNSITYPFDRFIIINNGKEKDVAEAIEQIEKTAPDKVIVYNSPKNLGVSGSWNLIIKNFPAPWTFICGNDVMFTPGDLEIMVEAAWAKHLDRVMLFGNQGHNAFIWTRRGVDKVGYFDENFYPAYLEDGDYSRRIGLLGEQQEDVQGCHIIHGELDANGQYQGSRTINSSARFRVANSLTHGNGFLYYQQKWGGAPGQEKFTHPFNNPAVSPKDWALIPEWRKKNDIWGI